MYIDIKDHIFDLENKLLMASTRSSSEEIKKYYPMILLSFVVREKYIIILREILFMKLKLNLKLQILI